MVTASHQGSPNDLFINYALVTFSGRDYPAQIFTGHFFLCVIDRLFQMWLITGGLGYIGAHVARELSSQEIDYVILDNLSTGVLSRLPNGKSLCNVDIRNLNSLKKVFEDFQIVGIIHLAGLKSNFDSMSRGLEYFDVNTLGTWNLAQCALQFNIERFIYSSTCAVYGEISGHTKVSESSLTAPTTDYGRSKLAAEWILKSLLEEKLTIFRYFNAIGQSTNELSDLSGESLFSAAKRAVVTGEIFKIFGNKFNTPDGTCLRDFIDCRDIARAHTLAISRTRSGAKLPTTINLGTGKSTSVLQVINEIRKWQDISWEYCGARSGDIAVSCADVNLAKQTLGFTAIHDVPSSVQSVFGTLVH